MPANTSAASAICGTHFGLTNADTSMTRQAGRAQPVDEGDLVGGRHGARASFCRPSRGPTSKTRTRGGRSGTADRRGRASASDLARSTSATPGCTRSPGAAVDGPDDAVARRADRAAPSSSLRAPRACRPARRRAPGRDGTSTTRWPASAASASRAGARGAAPAACGRLDTRPWNTPPIGSTPSRRPPWRHDRVRRVGLRAVDASTSLGRRRSTAKRVVHATAVGVAARPSNARRPM